MQDELREWRLKRDENYKKNEEAKLPNATNTTTPKTPDSKPPNKSKTLNSTNSAPVKVYVFTFPLLYLSILCFVSLH